MVPYQSGETPKNVLRVDAEQAELSFEVNGQQVYRMPRAEATVDGVFGLWMGDSVNMHVSRLDLVRHIAPPRRSATP